MQKRTALAVDEPEVTGAAGAGPRHVAGGAARQEGGVAHTHAHQRQSVPQEGIPASPGYI